MISDEHLDTIAVDHSPAEIDELIAEFRQLRRELEESRQSHQAAKKLALRAARERNLAIHDRVRFFTDGYYAFLGWTLGCVDDKTAIVPNIERYREQDAALADVRKSIGLDTTPAGEKRDG